MTEYWGYKEPNSKSVPSALFQMEWGVWKHIQVSFCATSPFVMFLSAGGEEKHCMNSPKFLFLKAKAIHPQT